jgi:hypothetical protein
MNSESDSNNTAGAVAQERLVVRLRAAKARLRYHSRPGHGASKTRLFPGEAKQMAKDDVHSLMHEIAKLKSSHNAELRDRHESATPPKPNDLPL